MSCEFPAIVCTELVLGGSPRVDGRRLAVGDVVSLIEDRNLKEVVDDFELKISEIRQALQYCSSLQCKIDMPVVFCHNCSLRRKQEGPVDTSDFEEIVLGSSTIVKGHNSIFLGSMSEMLEEGSGRDRWKIAAELLIDLRREMS
ncbi:DUF433 domain-containing protein [Hymenobacter aerophilus]|uniref:DUF433 domain-containing protein n=1 Tax=Hymenobacter aerophilus TaxID=119644 RepID=UPI00146F4E60|nr:DUF433 domain-containing protein [Hymenobacter aerophilus]